MADLVRLAHYPFLPGVRDAVRELGPPVADLLSSRRHEPVRRRAAQRVRRALADGVMETGTVRDDHDALEELLAHAVARMLLVCLGDRVLASRYAAKEAGRVRRLLRGEDDATVQAILARLGVPVQETDAAGGPAAGPRTPLTGAAHRGPPDPPAPHGAPRAVDDAATRALAPLGSAPGVPAPPLRPPHVATPHPLPDAPAHPAAVPPAPWRMYFADYLHHAPARQEWKLVLQTVAAGWVPMPRRAAEAFVEEALRRRIEGELHEEMRTPAPTDLRTALRPYLDELGPLLAQARTKWGSGDFGPVREGAFPPCIVQLFAQMKAGAMVPHHGRFAFASFLATIGMSGDQILDFMAQLPNFSRDKSEYQIRHIAGELGVEAYTPPGCATMQTHGICPLELRDDICFTIKHPLGYYRKRLRRLPEPVQDGTAKGGDRSAPAEAAQGGSATQPAAPARETQEKEVHT